MGHNVLKSKGRAITGRFIGLPHSLADSKAFMTLTPLSLKLWINMMMQYNGRNNGDINATFSEMRKWGWRSEASLHKALKELLRHGLIVKTRQGGIAFMSKICSLYAFTHVPICDLPKLGIKGQPPLNIYRDFDGEKCAEPKI